MRLALPLALLALLVAPAAGAARTFAPAGAGLTLDLPPGWHQTSPAKGFQFEAVGPRASGWVFLSVVRTVVTSRSFERSLVAFERRETRRLGPHVRFLAAQTTVDGEPAVAIAAAAPAATSEAIYGFQHRGREYLLVFAVPGGAPAAARPVFAAALRSVRFRETS